MFCFAAIQALTAALSAALGRAAPRLQSLACQLWGCGIMDYATLAACLPATVIVVVWFIGRHTLWAWPLQDAMGVALIMLLLRQFRLPDIKVNAQQCWRASAGQSSVLPCKAQISVPVARVAAGHQTGHCTSLYTIAGPGRYHFTCQEQIPFQDPAQRRKAGSPARVEQEQGLSSSNMPALRSQVRRGA